MQIVTCPCKAAIEISTTELNACCQVPSAPSAEEWSAMLDGRGWVFDGQGFFCSQAHARSAASPVAVLVVVLVCPCGQIARVEITGDLPPRDETAKKLGRSLYSLAASVGWKSNEAFAYCEDGHQDLEPEPVRVELGDGRIFRGRTALLFRSYRPAE